MHGAAARRAPRRRLAKGAWFGSSLGEGRHVRRRRQLGPVCCAPWAIPRPLPSEHVDVSFCSQAGSILVCKQGDGVDFDEDKATDILTEKEVIIDVDLHGATRAPSAGAAT